MRSFCRLRGPRYPAGVPSDPLSSLAAGGGKNHDRELFSAGNNTVPDHAFRHGVRKRQRSVSKLQQASFDCVLVSVDSLAIVRRRLIVCKPTTIPVWVAESRLVWGRESTWQFLREQEILSLKEGQFYLWRSMVACPKFQFVSSWKQLGRKCLNKQHNLVSVCS